jgi:hypothetical protein
MFPISPGLQPSTGRRVGPMLIGATHLTVSVMPDAIHTHWRSPQSIENYVASVHRRLRRASSLQSIEDYTRVPSLQSIEDYPGIIPTWSSPSDQSWNVYPISSWRSSSNSNLQSVEDYIWAYSHMIKSV